MRFLVFLCIAFLPCGVRAELLPQEQQAVAKRLGNKVQRFEMWTDKEGNVTGLIFINHQALTPTAGEKPGVTDADIAELAKLPKLTAVNFAAKPIVTELQLHRTALTPEQLVEVGKLQANLEVPWFKPNNDLKAEHLRAICGFGNLRVFSPQHFKNAIPYVDGWDSLTSLPSLERLEIAGPAADSNEQAIKQLQSTRSKLVVTEKLTRSRNYDGL